VTIFAADQARAQFARVFGTTDIGIAIAPGRVNLIGEHTDYNDGFVLPMAIDRHAVVAFRRRSDRRLRAHAVAFDETQEADIALLAPGGIEGWFAYVAGVAWALREAGYDPPGLDLVVQGTVPVGAGLSSSAALELAVARAFRAAHPWDSLEMARLGQRAENEFVGVSCGLMDQFAAAVSRPDSALLLDCRSLAHETVPIPESAAIVILDTGARRTLAGSAYNDRRAACEDAVRRLSTRNSGLVALRDVNEKMLEDGRELLDETTYRRALHIVREIHRPVAMAAALRAADLPEAGKLMNDSHASLRDLYEVSSPELDLVSDLARAQPACYGARMTGAGFGGCAIALVDKGEAENFQAEVGRRYRAEVDLPSDFFVCRPEAGARLLP
jgi:galactokinase